MEKHIEVERSIIKKYRKEIWKRFIAGINEYEMIKIEVMIRKINCHIEILAQASADLLETCALKISKSISLLFFMYFF